MAMPSSAGLLHRAIAQSGGMLRNAVVHGDRRFAAGAGALIVAAGTTPAYDPKKGVRSGTTQPGLLRSHGYPLRTKPLKSVQRRAAIDRVRRTGYKRGVVRQEKVHQ